MTQLEILYKQRDDVDQLLAEIRRVSGEKKRLVDAAQQEFEDAGRPQERDHPTRIAKEKALSEFDAANMEFNEYHRRYQVVVGKIMQEETAMHGSAGFTAQIARVAPAPDVQEISNRVTANAAADALKKAQARGEAPPDLPKDNKTNKNKK